MQLICRVIGGALITIATHADGQAVDLAAYGEDAIALPYAGPLGLADLVGLPAPAVDLAVYAAARRFALETRGIAVGGATIATDRASQQMIASAFAYMQASGAPTVKFKAASGWISLGADQVRTMALAVGAHVQAAFAAEDAADAGIQSGAITTLAQVDAAFAALA